MDKIVDNRLPVKGAGADDDDDDDSPAAPADLDAEAPEVSEAPETPEAPVERASRPEDHLRAAIIAGRLLPNERLVESELSRALGVGRTAIRTALARLEHEGLVEMERHRGARVRLVALAEAIEILEVRAVLEGLAARKAAANATEADVAALRQILAEMRRLLDAGDLLKVSDRNAILHRRVLKVGGHGTANRLSATLRSQLVRFEYRTILVPGRSERSFGEHSEIVEAIAAGDGDRAEAAMRLHLSHVAEALRAADEQAKNV